MSKIWMINLAFVAATLFVYGGLNWFDNRDPEVTTTAQNQSSLDQTAPDENVGVFSKVKSWFNNATSNNDVEYVRSEDGTMLPLTEPKYDEDTLVGQDKKTKARLKELESEIAVARKKVQDLFIPALVNEQIKRPNQQLAEELEYAKEDLQILEDEQAELLDRSASSSSSEL